MRNFLATATGPWHRLHAALTHRQLRWAQPTYRQPATRWLVLQSGPNPSTDYYIRPRAGADAVYRDIDADLPASSDFAAGTLVIVVRYLNRPWAEALQAHAAQLAGVVYFMDDDLLDPAAWRGLPGAYRNRLAQHFSAGMPGIAALASELWVSTPVLASRYASLQPRVVPPVPLVDDTLRTEAGTDFVRIFYHGSQAHEAEARWLRPIVAECLQACPHAQFEIIGNHAVNRLVRGLPRTRVLHPMSWPNYLAHCRTMRGHIGLAPLLPSSFNAGRSATRVFDVARCGAVGIYSRTAPYDCIQDGVDGLLVENEPSLWSQHLIALVGDRHRLTDLRRHAGERLLVSATR